MTPRALLLSDADHTDPLTPAIWNPILGWCICSHCEAKRRCTECKGNLRRRQVVWSILDKTFKERYRVCKCVSAKASE